MAAKKNRIIKLLTGLGIVAALAVGIWWWTSYSRVEILSIKLTSPNNSALLEDIEVKLNTRLPIYVVYWADSGGTKFRTPVTKPAKAHLVHLVLLKPNTTYHYKIVIDKLFDRPSATASFHTRKLGAWMVLDWVKEDKPHDATPLAGGLVMLCNGGKPGFIAMVDGGGNIRWYWQTDSLGVRAATLTPRGTLLVLLHPPTVDELNDVPDKEKRKRLNNLSYPIRRGKIGYTGGTAFAEVDLTGKVLWKVNINKDSLGYLCIHHDLRMDKQGNIISLIRDPLLFDLSKKGGKATDTLWGDALVKLDTTGRILWKWSPWDSWNFKTDNKLFMLSYDRFHLNAVWITDDGNYLVSSAIENQIWKINAKTGKLMWKLGKDGDFKMDPADYFYFQHAVNVLPSGNLMVFDNGDYAPFDTTGKKYRFTRMYSPSSNKRSRVLTFHLDTLSMTAETVKNIPLPASKYSSRMGSAYLLPNNNILVTSSKTGYVFVLNQEGNIRWELISYFIPYRAEYIPDTVWNKYRTKIK